MTLEVTPSRWLQIWGRKWMQDPSGSPSISNSPAALSLPFPGGSKAAAAGQGCMLLAAKLGQSCSHTPGIKAPAQAGESSGAESVIFKEHFAGREVSESGAVGEGTAPKHSFQQQASSLSSSSQNPLCEGPADGQGCTGRVPPPLP